ncbi:hypothetical protein JCM8115_002175, partial [Rhodotorula mucilaginosa]
TAHVRINEEEYLLAELVSSAQILPRTTIKRIDLINYSGTVYIDEDDVLSVPEAQAAYVVGFANGVESFTSVFGMTRDGDGVQDNLQDWLVHTHQLLHAMPKLRHLKLQMTIVNPDNEFEDGGTNWDEDVHARFDVLMRSIRTKATHTLDSLTLGVPHYEALVEEPVMLWQPRYLSITCRDPFEHTLHLLQAGKNRLRHLSLDVVPRLVAENRCHPIFFPKLVKLYLDHNLDLDGDGLDALPALIDPRTPVRQITYGTPSHQAPQHLRQFIESQPVRTVEEVFILWSVDWDENEVLKKQREDELREFFDWCDEQKIQVARGM